MHVERHVFGSVRGYGTLARSAGLTEAECRRLESLSFGTPYNASFQRSLAGQIAYLSRPLGPVKRALTRVAPGEMDDADRPTLLFITAVIYSEDWDFTAQGDALPLLGRAELWSWDGSPAPAALDLPDPKPGPLTFSRAAAGRILGLLSLVELSWATRAPVVVRADQYSIQEAAAVERLLPNHVRRRYSMVYRGLNPTMKATLICLADGASAGAAGKPCYLAEPKTPYALRLASEGFGDGREPRALLLGDAKFGEPNIDTNDLHLEGPTVNTHVGRGSAGIIRRGAAPVSTALLMLCFLLIFMIGGAAGWLAKPTGEASPAPTGEPPWPQLLNQAAQLLSLSHARQTEAIESIQDQLANDTHADPARYGELLKNLDEAKRSVKLRQKTVEAIGELSRDNKSSIPLANRALVELESEGVASSDMLRDWFETRQRPPTDTLAVALTSMRETIKADSIILETDANILDPHKLERAKGMHYALNLLAKASEDQPPHWIIESTSRLDSLIQRWGRELEELGEGTSKRQRNKRDKQEAAREQLGRRLDELAAALTSPEDNPSTREAVAEALKRLAAEGRDEMGAVFAKPMEQLAQWILELRHAATPDQFTTIQTAVDDCVVRAASLLKTADDFSTDNTAEENGKFVAELRTKARALQVELILLDDLAAKLTTPEETRNAESP